MWKAKGAGNFHAPVDPIKWGISDYFDVVKNPMDLGTVRKKLTNNVYMCLNEFISDMSTIFENCLLYNGTESVFGKIGV